MSQSVLANNMQILEGCFASLPNTVPYVLRTSNANFAALTIILQELVHSLSFAYVRATKKCYEF